MSGFILPLRDLCTAAASELPPPLFVPGCWLCLGNVHFFQPLSLEECPTLCKGKNLHLEVTHFFKEWIHADASYCGPNSATSSVGPTSKNKPGPFSSPTVRKTKVSFKEKTVKYSTNSICYAIRTESYLSIHFTGNDIHEVIVTFFPAKRVTFFKWWLFILSVGATNVSYLCKLKKLPLSGLLLKFWAMRTAMSLNRPRLVCKIN